MLSALKGSVDLNLLKRRSNAPTHAVQPPLSPPESMLISLSSLHVPVCLHVQEKLRIFFFKSTIKEPKPSTFNAVRNERVWTSVEQRTEQRAGRRQGQCHSQYCLS